MDAVCPEYSLLDNCVLEINNENILIVFKINLNPF